MPSNRYPDTQTWLDAFLTRNPMKPAQLAVLLDVHIKTVHNWGRGISCMSVRDRLALRYIELELKMADNKEPSITFGVQEAQITALVTEHLGVEAYKVTRDANLIDDLGADSLDVVELVMALENEFGVTITDEEGDSVETVQNVFDLIAAKTANASTIATDRHS